MNNIRKLLSLLAVFAWIGLTGCSESAREESGEAAEEMAEDVEETAEDAAETAEDMEEEVESEM